LWTGHFNLQKKVTKNFFEKNPATQNFQKYALKRTNFCMTSNFRNGENKYKISF